MSFISLPEDKVAKVVESGSDKATFEVKKVLSKSDVNYAFEVVIEATRNMPRSEAAAATDGIAPETQRLNLDMVMGLPSAQLAILKRAIVGWDLNYPKGHPDHPGPIPLTEENIEMLASPVVDELCDLIRGLNKVKTAEELENLGQRP